MKAALHYHDKILDDKIEDLKAKVGNMDATNDRMQAENDQI